MRIQKNCLSDLQAVKGPINDFPLSFLDFLSIKKIIRGQFFNDFQLHGQSLKSMHESFFEQLREHCASLDGLYAVTLITAYYESLIQSIIENASEEWKKLYSSSNEAFCLIGLGGLGRKDLSPFSDLDMLFLYDYKMSSFFEYILEKVLYLLWDLKLDVGYSVRSKLEIEDAYRKDLTFALSLVDHRLLYGSTDLYRKFVWLINRLSSYHLNRGCLWHIVSSWQDRHKKYLDTLHLLEPNIKEGKGGLRDFHNAWWSVALMYRVKKLSGWVDLGLIDKKELRSLLRSISFLWKLRTTLHIFNNRRTDRMDLALQERVAGLFVISYANASTSNGVERFMRQYYYFVRQVEDISANVLMRMAFLTPTSLKVHYLDSKPIHGPFIKCSYGLWLKDGEAFDNNPMLIMKSFLLSKKFSIPFSFELRQRIRRKLYLVDRKIRIDRKTISDFVNICSCYNNLGYTFKMLDRTGVLGKFIPEWMRIKNLAQHDIYHTYTTDIHSLKAVENLENIYKNHFYDSYKELRQILNQISNIAVLTLALLFHDIGKGWGRGHASTGARIVVKILSRMGLEDAFVNDVSFLVRHHLIMLDYAQKRDLDDPYLIEHFSNIVGSKERLDQLYILTICDLLAVSPVAMTCWKKSLLDELYRKTLNCMEGRLMVRCASSTDYVEGVRAELFKSLPKNTDKQFLSIAPSQYLVMITPKKALKHANLYSIARKKGFAIHLEAELPKALAHIDIIAKDRLGIFSLLVGGLSYLGFNILWSRIFTTVDGYALDMFKAEHVSLEDLTKNESYGNKIVGFMDKALMLNTSNMDEHIEKKRRAVKGSYIKPPRTRPNEVYLDNQLSNNFTIIDIKAYDRPFLLYDISKVLIAYNLSIAKANISTMSDQVIDTFYVQTKEGEKLKESLKRVLAFDLLKKLESNVVCKK